MIKMIYLLGIFVANIAFIAATKFLVQPSQNSESVFVVEWIGLILLSFTAFVFIYRDTCNNKKIQKFQEELDTYQISVSHELGMIGGRDA